MAVSLSENKLAKWLKWKRTVEMLLFEPYYSRHVQSTQFAGHRNSLLELLANPVRVIKATLKVLADSTGVIPQSR